MTEVVPHPDGYPIKIVRDKTPELINESGEPGDLFYGLTPDVELMKRLRQKLVEELGEYLLEPGVDELADVVAVISALADHSGSSIDELVEKIDEDPRGGFYDAVMMYGRHPEFDREEKA